MSGVQKQYVFLLFLIVASLAAFLLYFFLPPQRGGSIFSQQGRDAPPPLIPRKPGVLFVDRTEEWGLDVPSARLRPIDSIPQVMGSGAGLCDVDGDGDLDLYLVRGGPKEAARNLLFLNDGKGRFRDGTTESKTGDRGDGMGCVFGDIDNDGDPDLYVTNRGPDVLFRNYGDGTFTDVTVEAGLGDPSWGAGAAFGDIDGDGFVDLYVANYLTFDPSLAETEAGRIFDRGDPVALLPHPFKSEPDRLYRSRGGETFLDVTEEAGIRDPLGRGLAVVMADLDGDGDIDIYVANDVSQNLFFANRGDGTFFDAGGLSGLDDSRSGMGIALGDWDNNGTLDLFVTNWQNEANSLFRNIPGPPVRGLAAVFEDAAVSVGLDKPSLGVVGWGTGFLDYDCDGYLDILAVNGYTTPGSGDPAQCIPQRTQIFRNDGGERFLEGDVGPDLGRLRNGRGAALGDIDDDGDIDMVITTNRGKPVLLLNEGGNRNHWLKLRLHGKRSNRDGIGARVKVRIGDRTLTRVVTAGSSYLSHDALEVHFGLGSAEKVDSLEVIWPSGHRDTQALVPVDRTFILREQLRSP